MRAIEEINGAASLELNAARQTEGRGKVECEEVERGGGQVRGWIAAGLDSVAVGQKSCMTVFLL